MATDDERPETDHFSHTVRGVQHLVVTGHDGLRANEIIAEIYASAGG